MRLGRWGPLGALSLAPLAAFAPVARGGDCGCEAVQDVGSAGPVGAHDPAVVKEGKTFYLFTTGVGIPVRESRDLKAWSGERRVFDTPPEWAPKAIVGFRDHIWAPDVSRFGGKWHLFYSVSSFGKNRSAIGHATNATLDPTSPRYRWVDEGAVFQSYPTDDYNAIDPNVALDEKGKPWLSFGSFWSGIQLLPLGLDGRLLSGAKPVNVAGRPHEGPQQPGALEAPYIVRRGSWFYLFASYDFCCRGARSTYNVRVGRSRSIRGPYLDRGGKAMASGGGTQITFSDARWKGPGHEAVLRDGRQDYLVYHAYDAQDNGRPKLRVSKMGWDREGWPKVEEQ